MGALALTNMSLPTLHYFAFRGRALACRVALFNSLGKDGWIDKRVSLPRFKRADKPARNPDRVSSEYVTNNLPQLNLPSGAKVSQSHAIARYAAKLRVGELPDHQILLLTPKDADASTRAHNRQLFQDSGFLRVGMELLEGRIKTSGGSFLLGQQISLADLYVRAPLCDLFDLNQFEGVPPEFIEAFPHIRACGDAVLEHPLLKAYSENYRS